MKKKVFAGVALCAMAATLAALMLVRGAQIRGRGTQSVPYQPIFTAMLQEEYLALTNPEMTSIAAMDADIGDDTWGVSIAVEGEQEFYPFAILNWHYVVNRTTPEGNLAIYHDVLTGASIVYTTQSALTPTGEIYDNAMLLRDDAGVLWWPTRGVAVAGESGQTFSVYPSEIMTWEDWKDVYPTGSVLSNDTGTEYDYTRHPYGTYDTSRDVYYATNYNDARLDGPKEPVYGLARNGEAIAFPLSVLAEVGEARETLGGQTIVGVYDVERETIRVYATSPDGVQQEELTTQPMYWFAWASAYPETKIAAEAALAELNEDSSTPHANE